MSTVVGTRAGREAGSSFSLSLIINSYLSRSSPHPWWAAKDDRTMAELSRASPQSSSTSASPSHDDNGTNSNNTNGGGHWSPHQAGTLAATYPVNTLMEIKVAPAGNIIRGVVYCTDEFSNSIVIKRALVHTTTSSEITIVNADSVMEYKAIDITSEEAKELVGGVTGIDELKLPLPNVSKKALEEREKRAIRLAEESFGYINQKVSCFV